MPRVPALNTKGELVADVLVDDEHVDLIVFNTWRLGSRGYVEITRDGTPLHRLVMGCQKGDGAEVDHISGDRLDNRTSNLRICSRRENSQNVVSLGGQSRFRGVAPNARGGWRAQAQIDRKQIFLGHFQSEIAAACAAEAFRREHMPFSEPDPHLVIALQTTRRSTERSAA